MLQYYCFVALYNFKLTNANSIKLLYKITLINILFSGQNLFSLVNEDGEIIPNHLMQTGLLLYTDKTVCDDAFNENAADAICRELGYDESFSWESDNFWSMQSDLEIGLDEVFCSSDSWGTCSYEYEHDCSHSEDVFLTCRNSTTGKFSPCSMFTRHSLFFINHIKLNGTHYI